MTPVEDESLVTVRQSVILERATRNGFVRIEELATDLRVSAQTVRRDIIALTEAGLLQRFHGGAGPAGHGRLGYSAKHQISRPEKAVVGARAAADIPDHSAIYLDVGTTIECCARELAKRPGFLIFTNSTRAAMVFDPEQHQVHVLGGRVAGRDGSLIGENVALAVSELQLDFALIACSGIDVRGRVMDFHPSKIAIKKAAMHASHKSFLLVTKSKFGRSAISSIGNMDQFDRVFSERP